MRLPNLAVACEPDHTENRHKESKLMGREVKYTSADLTEVNGA